MVVGMRCFVGVVCFLDFEPSGGPFWVMLLLGLLLPPLAMALGFCPVQVKLFFRSGQSGPSPGKTYVFPARVNLLVLGRWVVLSGEQVVSLLRLVCPRA